MVALYLVPPKGGEHSGQAPKALAVRTEIIAQAQVAGNSVRARRLRRSACRLSGLRRHQKHHPRVVEAQQANAGATPISQMPFARGASKKSNRRHQMKKGLIRGVGRNDADYNVYRLINGERYMCPFYSRWKGMLERCYGKRYGHSSAYVDCKVDERWLSFMAFREWMQERPWKGNHLDKDLLRPGDKMYSPDTSVFIPAWLNNLLHDGHGSFRGLPTGVSIMRNKDRPYMVRIWTMEGRRAFLGSYATADDAHAAWKEAKSRVVLEAVDRYRLTEQHDERVCDALIDISQRFAA